MTSENTETDDEEQHEYGPGDRVSDRKEGEEHHLRVVARTPHEARHARIAAIGKTVAQLNPEYPDHDPVYICVYESTVDERFGDRWQGWTGAYLAFMVGNFGLQTYSFPASRLAAAEPRTPEKWKEAAERQEDGDDD